MQPNCQTCPKVGQTRQGTLQGALAMNAYHLSVGGEGCRPLMHMGPWVNTHCLVACPMGLMF
jgi:hypothetical protein